MFQLRSTGNHKQPLFYNKDKVTCIEPPNFIGTEVTACCFSVVAHFNKKVITAQNGRVNFIVLNQNDIQITYCDLYDVQPKRLFKQPSPSIDVGSRVCKMYHEGNLTPMFIELKDRFQETFDFRKLENHFEILNQESKRQKSLVKRVPPRIFSQLLRPKSKVSYTTLLRRFFQCRQKTVRNQLMTSFTWIPKINLVTIHVENIICAKIAKQAFTYTLKRKYMSHQSQNKAQHIHYS